MVQHMALALQGACHGPSNNDMGTAKGFLLLAQGLCKHTGGNQDTGFTPKTLMAVDLVAWEMSFYTGAGVLCKEGTADGLCCPRGLDTGVHCPVPTSSVLPEPRYGILAASVFLPFLTQAGEWAGQELLFARDSMDNALRKTRLSC